MYENKLQFITISSSYVINKTFPWGNEKNFFFIISKPLEYHLSVLSCINFKKMGSFYSAVTFNVTLINEKHLFLFLSGISTSWKPRFPFSHFTKVISAAYNNLFSCTRDSCEATISRRLLVKSHILVQSLFHFRL